MPNFIKNIAKDFLNIYVKEDDIRRAINSHNHL